MFKHKPPTKTKKATGKSFKFAEVTYDLAGGKAVGDEAQIALLFHQGGESASYYGRTITHEGPYSYRVDGITDPFDSIADAMSAIHPT
ncbi:MAG: hypothetical protein ACK46X_10575 [Candidatus Sericytochromatia bacterium]